MTPIEIFGEFHNEMESSFKKHGELPDDIVHAVAIMVEEAGESLQAALDVYYRKKDNKELLKEIIQTGAMCEKLMLKLTEEE